MEKGRILTKNQIKIIAAIAMVLDHVGAEFFPQIEVLRIIGRLAFPIFAYSIFEGARYTHDKLKYFLRIFILGIVCMAGYYIYDKEIYGNVLITFSLSIIILFSIRYLKASFEKSRGFTLLGFGMVCGSLLFTVAMCNMIYIDYGLLGVLMPVFAEMFDSFELPKESWNKDLALIGFMFGTLLLSIQMGGRQYFSLLALPLLFMTNERRGKHRMKYFFYIFYPAHLFLIGVTSMILL